tara:strand:- start:2021 stop:4006 length:1986 start_codon:yes stop_codon:yes gene_type:complete
MVKISKRDSSVVIHCKSGEKFLKNQDNKMFLQDCGDLYGKLIERKKNKEIEIFTDIEKIDELIFELKERFDEELENDKTVDKVFYRKKITEKQYEKYKKTGIAIKKKKRVKNRVFGAKKGFKLLPYQEIPVSHLVNIPNCANFSIPGAGKTIMTYAGFFILKKKKELDQMIVVGPRASFGPWKNEFSFFTGKKWKNHLIQYHGSKRHKMREKFSEYDIILTTYETATNDLTPLRQYIKSCGKKILLVLDESHKIKNINEKTKQANISRSQGMISVGEEVSRRCILTGTPLPHEWDDLWSQITFLWPSMKPLGSRQEFQEMIERLGEKKMQEEIQRIMGFMWTRVSRKQLKKDLPKQKFHEIEVPMDDIQEEIYTIIRSKLNKNLSGRTASFIKKMRRARVIRLLQVVTNPKLIVDKDPVHSSLAPEIKKDSRENIRILNLIQRYHKNQVSNKIKKAAELARSLSNDGKNVVIFTHFRGNVKILAKILKDKNPLRITGEITDSEIQEGIIEEFKKSKSKKNAGKILIATAGTIAESVSLHKNNQTNKPVCNNAIFLERSYDAGKYMQALHRIFRIGSQKNLPVNYFIFKSIFSDNRNTIDHTIDEILEIRKKRLEELVDDVKKLRIISLDTKTIGGEEQFYTEGDNEDQIIQKIELEEKKNM